MSHSKIKEPLPTLIWPGKETQPLLEPHILQEDPEKSYQYHPDTHYFDFFNSTPNEGIFDNHLIFGDNLLALKALEQDFTGKVKCVFIDPPYNTGNTFTHYNDNLKHAAYLSMMQERLTLIRPLLSEDGSLWITIDDNECHYLKVLCDEVFGRTNFVANVVWEKNRTPQNQARLINSTYDSILIYAKNIKKIVFHPLPRTQEINAKYTNRDNDPADLDYLNPSKNENIENMLFMKF